MLIGLLAAPSAEAGQIVWRKGKAIWAMSDTGTGARRLVDVSQVSGMNDIGRPHVAPTGSTVLFEGTTTRNNNTRSGICGSPGFFYSCSTFHYGQNGTGVYRLAGGRLSRLTAAPAPCFLCSTITTQPEIRRDGSYVALFMACSGAVDQGSYDCESTIQGAGFKPDCSNSVDASGPSPHPTTREVAYTGCEAPNGQSALKVGSASGGQRAVGCDDASQEDASWRPDGGLIITAERGTQPGLWEYDPDRNACEDNSGAYVLEVGENDKLASPRYAGSRIIFELNNEIWSIAASCDKCTIAQGRKLTSGANNSAPAWTGGSLAAGDPMTSARRFGAATRARVRIRFVLSRRANVAFKLQRRVGTRWRAAGSRTFRNVASGPSVVPIRNLKPGRYRVLLRASDAAARGRLRTVGFTVR